MLTPPFLLKFTYLMDILTGLEINHVLHEANTCADYLAKYVNKHLSGISFWSPPSSEVESLLVFDTRVA